MTMLGTKMYIAITPEMIQAIQKRPKVLAFPPIEAKFASKICGTAAKAHKILMTNVNGDEGKWSLSMESYQAIRSTPTPSPGLHEMNYKMIQNVAASFNTLIPASANYTKIELGEWLSSNLITATTNAICGP